MIVSSNPEIFLKRVEVLFEIEENLLIIIDDSGLIKDLSHGGAITLESKRETLIGKHITDILSSKYRNSFSSSFNVLIEEKKMVSFESGILTSAGNEILLDVNMMPVSFDRDISEIMFLGINITDRKDQENEIKKLKIKLIESDRLISIERQRVNQRKSILDELNRLKGEFISNISHEFRTPLASIIGFSETIASDPEMPEDMKNEFNTIILTEGKRLAKLINDILDISRIEGGRIDLHRINFDVIGSLNEIVELNKKAAESKGIVIVTEFPEDEIFIEADKERIGQMFNRLVNNAIKFTNDNGRVRIIARKLYKEFEFIISDTGIGIPEKDIPFIFQKFFRVSRPGTEIPGTGLGLVFVKQIVDLHRGFISVQSESGKGTTFLIKLPKNNA